MFEINRFYINVRECIYINRLVLFFFFSMLVVILLFVLRVYIIYFLFILKGNNRGYGLILFEIINSL